MLRKYDNCTLVKVGLPEAIRIADEKLYEIYRNFAYVTAIGRDLKAPNEHNHEIICDLHNNALDKIVVNSYILIFDKRSHLSLKKIIDCISQEKVSIKEIRKDYELEIKTYRDKFICHCDVGSYKRGKDDTIYVGEQQHLTPHIAEAVKKCYELHSLLIQSIKTSKDPGLLGQLKKKELPSSFEDFIELRVNITLKQIERLLKHDDS